MKRKKRLLWLFSVLVASSLSSMLSMAATQPDLYLFILAGQSNAVGQGDAGKSVDCSGMPCLEYDVISNQTKPLKDPVGQNWQLLEQARTGSVAPSFARRMYELSSRPVCMVTAARGGTSCHHKAWMPLYNTWDERGGMFTCAVDKINRAVKVYGRQPDGVIWMQGERDANAIRTGQMSKAEYQSALKSVISRFRHVYGKSLPFFIIETGYQQGADPSGCTAVRQVQQQVTREMSGVYIVYSATDKLPARGMYKDVVHYNQEALNEIGRCAADSVMNILAAPVRATSKYNRYGWRLDTDETGRFVLHDEARLRLLTDVASREGALEPYEYHPALVTAASCTRCTTKKCVYAHAGKSDLAMEIDLPKGKGPHPFILYVHGGGWESGSLKVFEQYSRYLASRGIAGVRIDYTLLKDGGTFSTVQAEIRSALDYVMQNHRRLGLDVARWGIVGGSAGAQLGAVAAMHTHGCKMFVGFYGAYNLLCSRMDNFPSVNLCRQYLGNTDEKTLMNASACYCIPKDSIPAVLLIHGTADLTINSEQSVLFADALKKKGGKVELIEEEGYGHAFTNASMSDLYEPALMKLLNFSERIFVTN